MANDPYCGNCHAWMTEMFPTVWVCNCTLSGHAADTTKDPNCHNSTHDHHDPESPIVLSNRAIRDAEEATELEAIRKREEAAAAEEGQQVQRTEPSLPVFNGPELDDPERVMGDPHNATGFVARDGPIDRPGSQFEGYTYEVAVFETATGRLLGWRTLREPEIDEETRDALDAILRETNERIEEE